jgi:hypothetical protein
MAKKLFPERFSADVSKAEKAIKAYLNNDERLAEY